MRRYSKAPVLGYGTSYGTSYLIPLVRNGLANGSIRFEEFTLDEGERLDILAGKYYNDSSLYWVIATASNIGWGLQVPPGTRIILPNFDDVKKLL